MDSTPNYFNLPNPQELYCHVWQYRPYHSAIKIRVSLENTEALFWLVFLAPTYFRGPMAWKGATFRLGTSEEYLALRQRTAAEIPKEAWLEDYKYGRLFIAEVDLDTASPKTVEILASKARVFPVKEKRDDENQ